eukprot:TRINITY_DN4678_c1_g1_i1.p1 TRINITY_DN4678_c1_g1~~TRINITY_DN4678_c1_g1_i1.p1  ORF type:complete len:333 (+),score=84.04 TRINITY_DN4678_c1_g1_i1:60-1058(+)
MEFPNLGKHCNYSGCNQLDFLPFTCHACHKIYCSDHRTCETHHCQGKTEDRRAIVCPMCNTPLAIKPGSDPNIVLDDHINQGCAKQGPKSYTCSSKGCKKVDPLPLICSKCRLHHCFRHRFELDHKCPGRPQNFPSYYNTPPQPSPTISASHPPPPPRPSPAPAMKPYHPPPTTTSTSQYRPPPPSQSSYPGLSSSSRPVAAQQAGPRAPQQQQQCTISVRLTNGETLRQPCATTTTLREVQSFIDATRTDGHGPYVLRTSHPRREFSYPDLDKTLGQLGLATGGMLILHAFGEEDSVVPQQPTQPPNSGSDGSGWWNAVSSFVGSLNPNNS